MHFHAKEDHCQSESLRMHPRLHIATYAPERTKKGFSLTWFIGAGFHSNIYWTSYAFETLGYILNIHIRTIMKTKYLSCLSRCRGRVKQSKYRSHRGVSGRVSYQWAVSMERTRIIQSDRGGSTGPQLWSKGRPRVALYLWYSSWYWHMKFYGW